MCAIREKARQERVRAAIRRKKGIETESVSLVSDRRSFLQNLFSQGNFKECVVETYENDKKKKTTTMTR